MIEKIKKHMDELPYVDKVGRGYKFGEFFPTEISPFAYNETIAFEEHPLSRAEVLAQGYAWREMAEKSYVSSVKSADLADDIKDVSDSVCAEVIACPNSGQVATQCTSAFKILPDELQFYRQMNLPLPRYCPNCRYHERLTWKNPFRFYQRQCMCARENHGHKSQCPNKFETMYPPSRPEKIYCKECYSREVL